MEERCRKVWLVNERVSEPGVYQCDSCNTWGRKNQMTFEEKDLLNDAVFKLCPGCGEDASWYKIKGS